MAHVRRWFLLPVVVPIAAGAQGAVAAPRAPRVTQPAVTATTPPPQPAAADPRVSAIPGGLFTTPAERLTPAQRQQLAQYGAGETRWRGVRGTHRVWMRVPCAACRGGAVDAIVFVRDGVVEGVQPVGAPGEVVPVQVPRNRP
jgi:hypothetical protein